MKLAWWLFTLSFALHGRSSKLHLGYFDLGMRYEGFSSQLPSHPTCFPHVQTYKELCQMKDCSSENKRCWLWLSKNLSVKDMNLHLFKKQLQKIELTLNTVPKDRRIMVSVLQTLIDHLGEPYRCPIYEDLLKTALLGDIRCDWRRDGRTLELFELGGRLQLRLY
jgi:hypothetical protein